MGQVTRAGRGGRVGLAALGVFVVAEVVWFAVSVLVLVLFAGDPGTADGRLPVGALVALLVVPTALAALVAVAGVALVGGGPGEGRVGRGLAVRWRPRDVAVGLGFGLGGLLVTIPAAVAWAAWVGGDDANSAVGEAFEGRQLPLAVAIGVFLAVWLLAPIGEEILFRGVLWRALEQWRFNRWVVFAVTSVVFSVAHLELLRTPLLLVLSIPVGLARLVTGNLLAAVVAHQANNFLPAVGLLLLTT